MPEEGVPLSPQKQLLTTPEIVALAQLFVSQGVTKIRLTGGEPTVRHDILPLMQQLGSLRRAGLKQLCITTNGIALHRKLDAMVDAGLTGVNLSLDTLDPWQYQIITRRNGFSAVRKSIDRIQEINRRATSDGSPRVKLKINCVVIRGRNDREIPAFVEMTRDEDIEVRFIEYMPFDGNKWAKDKMVSYGDMVELIRERYPAFSRLPGHEHNATSKQWHVPGFAGRIGFITSMTHNFCGTCNRLRITSDGNLKVCLFGNAEVSLRDILRKGNHGEPIEDGGFDGKNGRLIADLQERELLEVIGMAVKRKKAKHAGMGELENMKNRPMILIGG
jgi:cyclic pyranopterin phosphate synthase